MYEIFGISFGWNFSEHPDREVVAEYLESVGGQRPYSGGGEATTYIGEDLSGLDASTVGDGLTLIKFNEEINKNLTKSSRYKDISKWRQDIKEVLEEIKEDGDITDKECERILAEINKDPCVFFTWSTS